jgi:hypothetical protein
MQVKVADGTLAANSYPGFDAAADGGADATTFGLFSIDYDTYSAASSRAAAGTGGAATAFAVAPTATGVVGAITTVQELALIDNNVLNP